jgi:NADH-quinone oxidoreductase subunit C
VTTEEAVAAEETRLIPENPVLRTLIQSNPEASWSLSANQDVVRLPPDQVREFAQRAKDAGFELLADVTAVDWLDRRPRYEVVVNLLSLQHRLRLRVIAEVGGEAPTIPSLVPIWPGANYAEREVFDMFGIVFEGHPDLTRILMPDEWEGYPLRKDFATGSVPVQFKGAHKVN